MSVFTKKYINLNLLFGLIGLLIIIYPLFTQGMFMDGLYYASTCSNFLESSDSLWTLSFSNTIGKEFYEHPPLAIWLESCIHWLMDDSIFSERFYSLIVWGINVWIIRLLWVELGFEKQMSWIPIILWSSLPVVFWTFANNLLENTMGIFVSLSVLFFLKHLRTHNWSYLFLVGLMLFFAFLSKGFVGLYPLAFPFLCWLFNLRKVSFVRMTIQIFVILGVLLGAIGILMFVSTDANFYFNKYFENQVVRSVEEVTTVSFRGQIVINYFEQFSIPALFVLLLRVLGGRFYADKPSLKYNGVIWSLILLSLLGVLPIMISMKQRWFYILTVYPFVVLALSIWALPVLQIVQVKLDTWLAGSRMLVVNALLIGTIIFLGFYASTQFKRDQDLIESIGLFHQELPAVNEVCVTEDIRSQWGIIAYLQRYGKISVTQFDCDVNFRLNHPSSEDKSQYIQKGIIWFKP